jgi:hypothetical protein
MNAAVIEHVMNVAFPLAAVDAAMKLACRDTKGLSHYRHEEIPDRLIVYHINQQDPPAGIGTCGGIRIQYLTDQHTKLSVEVESCSEDLGISYGVVPEHAHLFSSDDLQTAIQGSGVRRVESYRKQILTDLCNQAIFDLTTNQPLDTLSPARSGGRPHVSRKDVVLRVALAMLEKKLKDKDKGMKRGEVIILARKNFGYTKDDVKETVIKDGLVRLNKAIEKNDEELLSAAEEKVNSWLSALSV